MLQDCPKEHASSGSSMQPHWKKFLIWSGERVNRRRQMQPIVPINITNMDATITEGFDFRWNGCTVNSGPLQIHLDDKARGEGDNRGVLDYQKNVARARLNVVVDLTGFARLMARAANCEPMQPLRAVLNSEGVITEDHNFGLSGTMEVLPHPLFGLEGVSAVVLPGH
jgi:hypothetical protein